MRLPIAADFPSSLTITIVPSPEQPSQPPSNILLLLHGLGDSHLPFCSLAAALRLPSTAYLIVRAPSPLPFPIALPDESAWHWGDDVVWDERTMAVDADAGFDRAVRLLWEDVVLAALLGRCGYRLRDVQVLGFGQGAMVALALAAAVASRPGDGAEGRELGGVVSIGGVLPAKVPVLAAKRKDGGASPTGATTEGEATTMTPKAAAKAKTPLLLLTASKGAITQTPLRRIKDVFADVEYVRWTKVEDAMPETREEMLPIMRFWARRLRSRAGVPEDAVEL